MAADTEQSPASSCPVDHKARAAWLDPSRISSSPSLGNKSKTCNSSSIDQKLPPSRTAPHPPRPNQLAFQREVSSIPRASSLDGRAQPANHEQESGASSTGNWIYPSEQMFFNAMRRKAFDPKAEDMTVIVPIHNAVNERAWKQIREWEAGRGAESPPFDRHDWVVDRCGTRIDYVIDFYAGKDDGSKKGLSFYLDVRPKLNSWEGMKMRMSKMLSIS
ncbi:MAG: Cytochrome c1 heme lyase [Phylliscum demangeonii]|nr:MAG: Cytochrome c1 heme lyase [Phylliscum demangeonii]